MTDEGRAPYPAVAEPEEIPRNVRGQKLLPPRAPAIRKPVFARNKLTGEIPETPHTYGYGGSGIRSTTIVVAASDSKQTSKDGADFVCTGTADDLTINAAIAALPSTGGQVRLMEGHFVVSGSILLPVSPKAVKLSGQGRENTFIQLEASHGSDLNVIDNASFTTGSDSCILEDLTLDGNKANQGAGTMNGIRLKANGDLFYRRVRVKQFGNDGMLLYGGNHQVENCTADNCNNGIQTLGTSLRVLNSTFASNTDGIRLEGGSFDTLIEGCDIYSNTNGIHNGGGGSNRVHIIGNTIRSNTVGINLFSAGAFAKCEIVGNDVHSNLQHGIDLGISMDSCLVAGNQVWDNSQQTDNTYDGIRLTNISTSGATNNTVTGNIVRRGTGNKHKYGIELSAYTSNNFVFGNDCYQSGSTGDIQDSGSANIIQANRTSTGYGGSTATAHNILSTIHGDSFATDTPADNEVLTWVAANSRWESKAATGGHTVQDEGTSLTQRTKLDFQGAGVTATDDGANDKTIVTVSNVGGQTLSAQSNSVGNVGAGEDDLHTYSVPGGTLGVNGEALTFQSAGTFGNTLNNKRIRARFGSALIFDSGALAITAPQDWALAGTIVRTGAATQKSYVELNTSSGTLSAYADYATASETLSGAVTLKTTGEATADNDVAEELFLVQKAPSSVSATGAAPADATYVTTIANATLTAEKVLPFLGNYDPRIAPASPNAANDEFDDDSIAGAWTQFGSPDTASESTYHGYLYLKDNDNTACGYRKTYAPGASTAFSVACRVSFVAEVDFGYVTLRVEDSGNANIAEVGLQRSGSGLRMRTLNGATETDTTLGGPLGTDWYLLITRDASNNYVLEVSPDGMAWRSVASFASATTVANLMFGMSSAGTSGNTSAVFDFVRVFTTVTETIGGTP